VLDSVSRVAGHIMDQKHAAARQQVLRLLAKYREIEELVQIGAYASGADPESDTAIDLVEPLNELLRQRSDEPGRFEKALDMMVKLAFQSGEMIQQRKAMRAAGQQPAPARGRGR
jgi:flagellum-specific ATP synthase